MNLSHRSYQKELLDADNIPFKDIRQNMRELDTINSLLGGHRITINGFKKLAGDKKTVSVCEIGCGGGDNLVAIVKWGNQNGLTVTCTGIDIKKECIEVAAEQELLANSTWIVNDYREVKFDVLPDIIFSSLFCHHFTNEELKEQLEWMYKNSRKGCFINDLHRHWMAYHSIWLLTKLFSSSYLVKNDAPVSVSRGFTKSDWKNILQDTTIDHYTIQWQWAFRHLIICRHNG